MIAWSASPGRSPAASARLPGSTLVIRPPVGFIRLRVVTAVQVPQRERDALLFGAEPLDEGLDLLTDLDDLFRANLTIGHLGGGKQGLDTGLDLDEGAEGGELRDATGDDLAFGVTIREGGPGIFLKLLERQGDLVGLAVDLEDLEGQLVADVQHVRGVLNALPRDLGDREQAVDAAEVDERAEVGDPDDLAGDDLTHLEGGEDFGAELALLGRNRLAVRQDELVPALIHFDDLERQLGAHQLLVGALGAELRGGNEAAELVGIHDHATLDDTGDPGVDDLLFLVVLGRLHPAASLIDAPLGQGQLTVLVLLTEDVKLDLIAFGDDVPRVGPGDVGELLNRNHAFRLAADIHQDLVGRNLDDDTLDDIALLEINERALVVDFGDFVGSVLLQFPHSRCSPTFLSDFFTGPHNARLLIRPMRPILPSA